MTTTRPKLSIRPNHRLRCELKIRRCEADAATKAMRDQGPVTPAQCGAQRQGRLRLENNWALDPTAENSSLI